MQILLPDRQAVTMEELRGRALALTGAEPFHESIVNACADLSQRIFRDAAARRYPELQALAFWIRKAELQCLAAEFKAMDRVDSVLMPRGMVFHVPPRNVDTMFVYSWLLSALTGNRNVLRLSPQRSESTDVLLRLFREALSNAAAPANNGTLVVEYGHETEPTEMLSALCDVRVIWGGDRTVQSIRRAPLMPHAREIAFPDRYSMAALATSAYLALDDAGRDALAQQFFNDSFWFDQMGCSSPRLVLWCGDTSMSARASADFFPRVDAWALRRGYLPPAAIAMQKFVFACTATLDGPVTKYRQLRTTSVLTLASLGAFDRQHPGGGLFFEAYLESVGDLAPMLERKDQTLTAFGFPAEELHRLVRALNGRGLDRIVPIGQALQFQRFWDGLDLLREFCRQVYVG